MQFETKETLGTIMETLVKLEIDNLKIAIIGTPQVKQIMLLPDGDND